MQQHPDIQPLVERAPALVVLNNAYFYEGLSLIEYLREVGVHFRMGTLLSRETVK